MKNLTAKNLSVDYEVEMPTGMGSGCYYMDTASAEEVFMCKPGRWNSIKNIGCVGIRYFFNYKLFAMA